LVDNGVDVSSEPGDIDGRERAEPFNQEPGSETPSRKRTELGHGFSVARDRDAFPACTLPTTSPP